MKLARVFSAGAGCSSVFYLAIAVLIVVRVPYGRSQAPAAVTTSRALRDLLTGIIPFASVYAADTRFAVRTTNTGAAFSAELAHRQQQREIEKSKQAKRKL